MEESLKESKKEEEKRQKAAEEKATIASQQSSEDIRAFYDQLLNQKEDGKQEGGSRDGSRQGEGSTALPWDSDEEGFAWDDDEDDDNEELPPLEPIDASKPGACCCIPASFWLSFSWNITEWNRRE